MIGLQTTSIRSKFTRAVSRSLPTAKRDGSRFVDASSILSSDRLHRASIRYLGRKGNIHSLVSSVEISFALHTVLQPILDFLLEPGMPLVQGVHMDPK